MKVSTCSNRPALVPCRLKTFDYQIDPYVGCQHGCRYCYALNQSETDWSKEVLIHKDIAGQLGGELESISPQKIYLGYYSDPYQPCEAEYRQTRQVLELLLENNFSAGILTKSDLIVRDLDILREMDNASASVSVAFNDNRIRQKFEANTIDTEARINALQRLREAGIRTSALICPVVPFITEVAPLIEMLAPYTDAIWLYGLSIEDRTGTNWRNVQGILKTDFPDLEKQIETALFAEEHPYWAEQRQQITEIKTDRELDLRIHL